MESKKNKKIFNIIMAAIIVMVAAAGVFAVGSLKGWFADEEKVLATAENVAGIVSVERSGVSFEIEKGDPLNAGDKITTNEKAEILLKSGGNTYKLAENSKAVLGKTEDGRYTAELEAGEMFIVLNKVESFGKITAQGRTITADGTVFSVNAQTGSMGVSVFEGAVKVLEGEASAEAKAGESVSIVGGYMEVVTLEAASLNRFNLDNAIEACKSRELCFSAEELEKVIEDREKESEAAAEESKAEENQNKDKKPQSSSKPSDSKDSKNDKDNGGKNDEGGKDKDSSQNGGKDSPNVKPAVKFDYSCTIEIRCDTILNNMDKLEKGKEGYVPSSGAILKRTSVGFNEGETVFDVLKRVCKLKGILMEASWTPAYGSSYVEGINNIYEFDCGPQSGWMYKVNGWFPNYGCSSYKLKDGDVISWLYTCEGLGADLGASVNR